MMNFPPPYRPLSFGDSPKKSQRSARALKLRGIPRAAVFALAAAGLLSACGTTNGPSLAIGGDPQRSVAVARGAVVIAGPEGYCVDRRGSRLGGEHAFVLLASCAAMARQGGPDAPYLPSLLTASVDKTEGAPPSLTALRAFIMSADGRRAMARDGDPASAEVLSTDTVAGALILRVRDASAGNPDLLEQSYWRGLFSQNGRMVTVTAQGFRKTGLPLEDGRSKLLAFIREIRAATPEQSASEPGDAPKTRAPFLSRLFQ